MTSNFAVGSLVSARGRDWVVLPESEADMLVLRPLGGADDEIAAVFPGFETVTSAAFPPPTASDLGDAHAAGLLRTALRIGFRSGAGPFRSLAGIAVEPRPYQVVPLLMALRQSTVRLLIADDVGIGKTVEAGLIAAELLAQGDARRIAVLCSPALAEQWQDELRSKFGLDAELVLSSTVPRLERGLELGQSLFQKYQHVVVSTDFIKSTRHRDEFVQHCPDLVIVDEAHSCVASDEPGARDRQLRFELLNKIARTDRHLVLVTATPHSGKESTFRNLLGLLRPDFAALDITKGPGRILLAQYLVQRRRADIRKYLNEETAFPSDRLILNEPYRLSPEYRALLDDAIAYARDRVVSAGEYGKREARIAWWSAIALLRSLVSSPRAAAQTLRTRSAAVLAATAEEADELGAPGARDYIDANVLEGMDVAPGAAMEATVNRLAELADRAENLEGPKADRKLDVLIKHVKALFKEGYHPIVFCRFIPTAEYVAEYLDLKLGRNTHVRAVTGTLSPQQRIQRIDELAEQTRDDPAARRVLVATDCLSEGVNLQNSFDAVVHYDLAWNPTRHDQREGRVDRYGQRRDQVKVITMYGSDNGIDGKVLDVLIQKHRRIRDSLGISVSVPDEQSAAVSDAIWEWVLMRGEDRQQEGLFAIDDLLGAVEAKADELEHEWISTAEREKASRSRFAQNAIRLDEVAREVAASRDALGDPGEVGEFVRTALTMLGAVLRDDGAGGFTADLSSCPLGVRDALDAGVGAGTVSNGKTLPFRAIAAVTRGEAALVRTDPVVAALATYVLNAALEVTADDSRRPARRCGVIRTDAVSIRTTLLLVRYRFHLSLRSRSGSRELVAEDTRVFGFEGAAGEAAWLSPDAATALLSAEATVNTDPLLGERTMTRILDGLADKVSPYLDERGVELAERLRNSHRRVRSAYGEIIGGVEVQAQPGADLLGVYVYLPAPREGQA
ncbi:helicase-related protein [Nocardia sp. CA-135398]|uniref:helicase-related protein n=1 Tax=Nocardia sp. CA-135398 TaxID=3239977 RepID=UPI003D99E128